MNRREFIRTSLAGAALTALPRISLGEDAASPPPRPAKRPNIVFVVADDMGWRDTGYQGSPNIKTPCLDALVANGVRFDYFYAAQQREKPIGFMLWHGEKSPAGTRLGTIDFVKGTQGVWIEGSMKLIVAQSGMETFNDRHRARTNRPGLYDIHADPGDSKDLSAAMPDRATAMRAALDRWRQSVRDSFDGKDYAK